MLFQSFPFLFGFLPVVFVLFWTLRGTAARQAVLLAASYVFYAGWDWRFCGLLLLSSTVDFVAAGKIETATGERPRRAWLAASLAVNLGALGFFKYWDFFADSTRRLFDAVGWQASVPLLDLVLPIGISFYTFQSLSYTLDVYRGRTRATRSPLKFLTFVSFFPQLVAGPIVRWRELGGQLDRLAGRLDPRLLALGACFFVVGLFKKVCIADWMFPLVDPGRLAHLGALEFWPAYVGWTFWIYYDFSSYSDMAVGLGLAFGLRLPQNFDSPYKAASIADLWRRWHMTLGRWMRDYLFYELGRGRRSYARRMLDVLVVFALIGLWHGASWTMVGWGTYMGLGLVAELVGRRLGLRVGPRPVRHALVFLFWLNGGWFFRADSPGAVADFFAAAFGANGLGHFEVLTAAVVAAAAAHCFAAPNLWQWKWRLAWWEVAALTAMFLTAASRMFVVKPFFYFQF